jgi:ribonuclease VapC
MIAIDTSALMAIVGKETFAQACIGVLDEETELVIAAATVTEALIVGGRRNVGSVMTRLLDALPLRIEPVTEAFARRAAAAYALWGRGVHPAALNFGDCFSYAVAKQYDCPLLYVGNDFARTDIRGALPAP